MVISVVRVLTIMPWPEERDSARDGRDSGPQQSLSRGSSVSELVRSYDDGSGKRDRSESGDAPVPTVKRGALDRGGEPSRSPAHRSQASLREHFDDAMERLEGRLNAFLASELHEFRAAFQSQLDAFGARLKDLESHVEARDGLIDDLSSQLREAKEEISHLQVRTEEAEIISRLPCLVLSGGALAARNAPPPQDGPAGQPASAPGQQRPGPATTSRADPARRDREARPRRAGAGSGPDEQEDVCSLVVHTLNQCFSDLNVTESDIDRAHRLPGPNNRIIVRFVRSGRGSIRDMVMWRRLELTGKDLYVNESLTPLRSKIHRSLLNAKREKKIHTVYSRGGRVFFKREKYAVGERVESLDRLRQLGFSVQEDLPPRASRDEWRVAEGRRGLSAR